MKKPEHDRFGQRGEIVDHFIRGFVAAGLLTAVAGNDGQRRPDARKIARRAIQGGVAIAIGVSASRSIARREYGSAALAVTVGAACLAAAEYIVCDKE